MKSAALDTGGFQAAPAEAPGTSFRDPDGWVVRRNGRVLRFVRPDRAAELRDFLAGDVARRLISCGSFIDARELAPAEAPTTEGVWFEHPPVWFPSYPYEWCPAMLHAAGKLTLDLALELLAHGLGLKDASPYNVLFRGPDPVFVDALSVERRAPGDSVWRPYAQFASTFLLPLALNRECGLPMRDLLLARRDGVAPEDAWRILGLGRRLKRPFLGLVTIPELLRRAGAVKEAHYSRQETGSAEKAQFVLSCVFGRLKRSLRKLSPCLGVESRWTGYMNHLSFGQQAFEIKERFVADALRGASPRRVLDIGCNTGAFSTAAARTGAEVVAIDSDEAVVDRLWSVAAAGKLNILPLVVDLARPSPALGWKNAECASFLERARAQFDMVLMLAVLHHLMVTDRVPLEEILNQAAELTTRDLLIEYVDPRDEMFRKIARGRDALHSGLNVSVFRHACERRFRILRSVALNETRHLHLLRRI